MPTYNPENQYRCTIIRGKAQNEVDDLLPAYAKIINDICPCERNRFIEDFDKAIGKYLYSPTKKTAANHRTEMAGKLFGMYWEDSDGNIRISPRTERLLEQRDNPEFFKDIASRLQFPNGMDKFETTIERINNKIKIRPAAYVLRLLCEAEKDRFVFTKDEIAYYVLNNLDVLQGWVPVETVLGMVRTRRTDKIFKRVEHPAKASSYGMQHITELLNILELANLIKQHRGQSAVTIHLNRAERKTINYLAESALLEPAFDIYGYDLANSDPMKRVMERRRLALDWDFYYANSDIDSPDFSTKPESLTGGLETPHDHVAAPGLDTAAIGEAGEMIVLAREKKRVAGFNSRLANRVIYFGKQKGLGYDISSIKADNGPQAEHAIYIEVKTTMRVTKPQTPLKDQFDLTRNEWVAAEQHGENFYIFRVYITNEGIWVFKIQNPTQIQNPELFYAVPQKYHVEFKVSEGELMPWTE